MQSKFLIPIGNYLFRNFFALYDFLYSIFKTKQDAFEISLIHKIIKKNDVVVDIGANIGFYTKLFSRLVGENGFVYAFEPDAKNYAHLKRKMSGINNVSLSSAAVASETGKLKIYTSPMLNVDHRTYPVDDYEKVIEIDAVSIDDFFSEKNKKPDFIKMDIQGAEYSALKGMQKILMASPHVIILTECWPHGLRMAKSSVEELVQLIQAIGLKIFVLGNKKIELLNDSHIDNYRNYPPDKFENILISRGDITLKS